MTEFGDRADAFRTARTQRGQVGARGWDELLTGDRDRLDLVVGEGGVVGGVQRHQRLGPERVGAGVVQAVVEGDQAQHLARARVTLRR